MRRPSSWLVLLSTIAVLIFAREAGCTEVLDPGFGSAGQIITDFAAGADSLDAVVVQPDGKIVAGGVGTVANGDRAFALARYNADGSLDPAFGAGGLVNAEFPGTVQSLMLAVALQPDGKILAAGSANFTATEPDFCIARYNTDGTLDASFGNAGVVIVNIAPAIVADDEAQTIAVQPDNKIIVAGYTVPHTGGDYNFAVARLMPDGSFDNTFSGDGRMFLDFLGGFDDLCYTTALDSATGKIYLGGQAWDAGGVNSEMAFARLNSDGTLDATFGVSGKLVLSLTPDSEEADDIKLQSDGKLLIAGLQYAGSVSGYQSLLARLNTNGTLDPSFGVAGFDDYNFGYSWAVLAHVALQPDGKIVTAGYLTLATDRYLGAARFNPDGTIDTTFGNGGLAAASFGLTTVYGGGLALQSDGKVIVAGGRWSGQTIDTSDFFSVRFASCLFCDDFEDSVLDPNWDYAKPQWNEANGVLVGIPDTKKAQAIASPAYAGCTACVFAAKIASDGGDSDKVSLFAWYTDKKNTVEVLIKQSSGKVILRQKVNGTTTGKSKASVSLSPGVQSEVVVAYDGTQFRLTIDGTLLATLTASGTPFGTAGFQVKNTTGTFGDIVVVP